MVTQELLDYIKQSIENGQTKDDIVGVLVQNGWNSTDVEQAFSNIAKKPANENLQVSTGPDDLVFTTAAQNEQVVDEIPIHTKSSNTAMYILLGVVIVSLIIAVIVLFSSQNKQNIQGALVELEEVKVQQEQNTEMKGSTVAKDSKEVTESNQSLYEYIMNGPDEDLGECTVVPSNVPTILFTPATMIDCDMDINAIFLGVMRKTNERLSYLPDIDDDEDAFYEAFYASAPELAADILTDKSRDISEISNFSDLARFVGLIETNYPYIEKVVKKYEDYVPLTEDQMNLFRSSVKVYTLEESLEDAVTEEDVDEIKELYASGDAYVDYPDPNDPRFSYMLEVTTEFKDGEITFPAPELKFPIFSVNEKRIAAHLGEWYTAIQFDLVNVNGEWKFDLIEPLRPGVEINPRIRFFGLREHVLEEYWKKVERMVKVYGEEGSAAERFRKWWFSSSIEEKQSFSDQLDGVESLEYSNIHVAEFYKDFYLDANLREKDGMLYIVTKTGKEARIRETENGWILEFTDL